MPKTCAPQTCQRPDAKRAKTNPSHTLDLKQLIPRLVSTHDHTVIGRLCAESLERISQEYEINNRVPVFLKLNALATDPAQPRNSMLGLFFICLDIDIRLKNMMVSVENDCVKAKLVSFFATLRSTVIPKFFCEESTGVDELVTECHDAYLIA